MPQTLFEGKMGGTLGGILGIFFVALRTAVEKNTDLAQNQGIPALWAKALSTALDHLTHYTPAKI